MDGKPRHSDLSKKSLQELRRLKAQLRDRLGRRQVDLFLHKCEMTQDPQLLERLGAVSQEIERRGGDELYREATRMLLANDQAHITREAEELTRARRGGAAAESLEKSAHVAIGGTPKTTTLGENINRLRKECGWSFDQLSEKTGIDKKAILSHIRGKSKPRPSTAKEYAQAFTKELQRKITANDLEG